ncbi:glycosyl hydrolase 53 family protein [Moheibacter lacus]|uniref:Arabinogalactan endo-beta-1,4-galactanase n=1 Tax=Moheibacter lacus TaxID=2745851 RepID=A0A838ZHQ1_9FLAO|nr:glycosyl hydrolase 53 family protein [Moheibacter lacus]MBA5629201.1 glycosyl hydrolase 53 family protein [Moheibacter lacus]
MKEKSNILNPNEPIIWGINGHPVTSKDYLKISIDQQLQILQQHQISYYRFDVRLDLEGNVVWYENEFEELLKKSQSYQIELMPVILINLFFDDYQITEEEAFLRGQRQMKGFVSKYGQNIDVYALGNEQDLRLLKNDSTGLYPSDYEVDKFKIVAAYFKGMISGIKQVNPNSKTIINSSNGLYFGYYQLLEDYQIDYDIIGYQWYSFSYGSEKIFADAIMDLYSQFKKPIWVTEINRTHGSLEDDNNDQSYLMDSFMRTLNLIPEIKAFFIYELFDEPSLKGLHKEFEQSQYGIFKWNGSNKIEPKPVSDVVKLNIEEKKNGSENYVFSVFQKLLLKEPSKDELDFWSKQFESANSMESFLELFLSEQQVYFEKVLSLNRSAKERKEISGVKTDQVYEQYLNRLPNPVEKRFWVSKLSTKSPIFDIHRTILLSEEFWVNAMRNGYERNSGFKFNN